MHLDGSYHLKSVPSPNWQVLAIGDELYCGVKVISLDRVPLCPKGIPFCTGAMEA
jgi:hypothetical protein